MYYILTQANPVRSQPSNQTLLLNSQIFPLFCPQKHPPLYPQCPLPNQPLSPTLLLLNRRTYIVFAMQLALSQGHALAAPPKEMPMDTAGKMHPVQRQKHAPFVGSQAAAPWNIIIPMGNVQNADLQFQIIHRKLWCGFPPRAAKNITRMPDAVI